MLNTSMSSRQRHCVNTHLINATVSAPNMPTPSCQRHCANTQHAKITVPTPNMPTPSCQRHCVSTQHVNAITSPLHMPTRPPSVPHISTLSDSTPPRQRSRRTPTPQRRVRPAPNRAFFPPKKRRLTSKSSVRRRMRVARLEAWGNVAIWLIHSDTVLVSLVVRGNAALMRTSAASHTLEDKVGGGGRTPKRWGAKRTQQPRKGSWSLNAVLGFFLRWTGGGWMWGFWGSSVLGTPRSTPAHPSQEEPQYWGPQESQYGTPILGTLRMPTSNPNPSISRGTPILGTPRTTTSNPSPSISRRTPILGTLGIPI